MCNVLVAHADTLVQERQKQQQPPQKTSPQYAREEESYNCKLQSATQDPIMGHEGQPGRRAAVPPGCPDNLEAGSSSSLQSHGKTGGQIPGPSA